MSHRSLLRTSCSILFVAWAAASPLAAGGGDADPAGFLRLDRELAASAAPQSSAAATPAQDAARLESSWATDVFFLVGGRELDDTAAWEGLEKPVAFGMEFSARRRGSWLGFEGGFQAAYDETTVLGVDVSDLFLELYFGGRITGDLGSEGRVHPYLGLGGTLLYTEVSGEAGGLALSEDDTSLGFYGHAGVYARLGRAFLLGLDARLVTGTDVSVFGVDTDSDYAQVSLLLGWSA